MGATESISEYEMGRAATHVPAPEGVDIDTEEEPGQDKTARTPQTAPVDKPPETPPQKP